MRSTSSSSLGDAITIDALAADPYPLVARLREHEPVAWSAPMGRWLISRHDLILEVLGDVDRFTTEHERSPIRATFGPQMLSSDGAEQRRNRGPFSPAFRPSAIRSGFGESVRWRAERIVEALEPGDDLTEPASTMAVATALDVLGLPGLASVDTVANWYEDLAAALANVVGDPEVAARGQRAAGAFRTAMIDGTVDRGRLIEPVDHGLDFDERASNTLLVLFGGIETTQSAMLNALWALAVHDDTQAAVRGDRTRLAAVVEESLRWEPAVLTLTRFTTSDVELDGVSIPADSTVECLIAGANRDPAVFDDPGRYDPERPNAADHLTFGFGRHHCLGAHLARMEALAFIDALLDVSPDGFAFAEPEPPGPCGHEFRRPPQLRLSW